MKAAIVGGGVIGGGWAARFLLNGWDVDLFDPAPDAERKLEDVLGLARTSLPALYDRALPDAGTIRIRTTIADAVEGADWVQESVPERLDVKRKVLADIQKSALPTALIGSSTSGFTPTALQEEAVDPSRILVCHPFNPVYLLPLVEVVASAANPPEVIAAATATLGAIGMHPLEVTAEIDAHIADRLLEAVWREALWLVKDGVATTADVDDAIRLGFGLRWAQMGLFETYRIAGGEAGMRHFLAQFGPALQWPWSKLTDVPDLDDVLIERIAEQSDAQAAGRSVRQLERERDRNIVGLLRALKRSDAGAGSVLRAHEAALGLTPAGEAAPPVTVQRCVPATWLDANGHVNEVHYLELCSQATDRMLEILGADAAYIAAGHGYFTVETHLRHLGEIVDGEKVRVTTQILKAGGRTLTLFHRLEGADDGSLRATGEHLLVHMDLRTRQSVLPDGPHAVRVGKAMSAHALLPAPCGAGRHVGQKV